MIDFEYIKNNRIVIACENEYEMSILWNECQGHVANSVPSYHRFFEHKDNVCKYGWNSTPGYYIDRGYKIVNVTELIKPENSPDIEIDWSCFREVLYGN